MAVYMVLTEDEQQFETLINGLMDKGFGCCDSFLDTTVLEGLRANLLRHYEKGEMQPAGVGRKFDYAKNTEVRGDVIRWIEPKTDNPHERAFLYKLERFIHHLNDTCYTGINGYEFHYAYYSAGSFYKKHLDRFKSDRGREFSFVLYLNEDWQEENKGTLTLYLENEELSISPVAGRVVFFRSDQTEHEVQASVDRPRLSIAGWLKRV